ncbi:MAG: phosphatidylserine decarboxylase [Clostridiales bacterium]
MINVYNRNTKTYDIEKVAGDKWLKLLYNKYIGRITLDLLIKRKIFSEITRVYCDMKISRKKIKKFVEDFNIDKNESLKDIDAFNTFNEFFTRKLKEDSRKYIKDKNILISPGDGRIKVWENIDINKVLQVKGKEYKLSNLIKNKDLAEEYKNGVCLLLRLAPVDYHRFHFVDSGKCSRIHKIKGSYYSVNPIALESMADVFCQNKRIYSVFKSDNFGDIIYVEVGATSVGSIVSTYKKDTIIKKGDEKGYFKFGGSTIILFIKEGKVKIDEDILNQTNEGFETRVYARESIGTKSI